MMKKYIILFLISFLMLNLNAKLEYFEDNPAINHNRKELNIQIPILNMDINMQNSLFSYTNLEIFDLDRYEDANLMSDSDKDIFTSGDLDLAAQFKLNILGIGYDNWDYSMQFIAMSDLHLIDKQYAELIFYGNEINKDYIGDSGDDSHGYAFVKSSIHYSHPTELGFAMIHPKVAKLLNKSNVGKFIDAMPIYLGANLNLNYSLFYGEVMDSKQRFGTMAEYNYYDYNLDAQFTDGDSNGKLGIGLGFGAKIGVLENGWLHFSIDDLFTKLAFENLQGIEYEAVFVDSLLYLDEDYSAYDESTLNDSIRYSSKEFNIKPSVLVGFEYSPIEKLILQTKYDNRQYNPKPGFSIAGGYQISDNYSAKLILGSSKGVGYSELQGGMSFNHVSFDLALGNSGGLFNSAKGIGARTRITIRF